MTKTYRQPHCREDWQDITKLRFKDSNDKIVAVFFIDEIVPAYDKPIIVVWQCSSNYLYTSFVNIGGECALAQHRSVLVATEQPEPKTTMNKPRFYKIEISAAMQSNWGDMLNDIVDMLESSGYKHIPDGWGNNDFIYVDRYFKHFILCEDGDVPFCDDELMQTISKDRDITLEFLNKNPYHFY